MRLQLTFIGHLTLNFCNQQLYICMFGMALFLLCFSFVMSYKMFVCIVNTKPILGLHLFCQYYFNVLQMRIYSKSHEHQGSTQFAKTLILDILFQNYNNKGNDTLSSSGQYCSNLHQLNVSHAKTIYRLQFEYI